ncbi:hypothetical protein N9L68_08390 [bacterium]|nr:hypothetical protein [bacterium]
MLIEQAEARHMERKCRFSKRKQGTRRGNADLAGGSRRKRGTRRGNADLAGGSKAH